MKNIVKIFSAGLLALSLWSCTNNKVDYQTCDFVTFANKSFSVKENAAEVKIPVNLYSSTTKTVTVTYTITEGEDFAVSGEDYSIEGSVGTLTISNDPNQPSDSIVIKPVSKEGVVQGNKKIQIVLAELAEDGVQKSGIDTCKVTIIDVDGGINLLVGNWVGSGLASDKNPVDIDWDLELVSADDPNLENYPDANVMIAAGSTIKDPMGNNWELQVPVYCYFDDGKSELHIYPYQIFAGGNFGEKVGVLYISLETVATLNGVDTDFIFQVEDGVLTLMSKMVLALSSMDDSGNLTLTDHFCGAVSADGKIYKK